MEFLSQTWHWAVSGFIIGLIMLTLTYFGKNFGMSTNLRTLCSMAGAGKKYSFFDWDWQSQKWNLIVVIGAMFGGFVAIQFMSSPENVTLNPKTILQLEALAIDAPNGKLAPNKLFGTEIFSNIYSIFILIIGGFLIGFGSRYAGGCTSGHAISGLSNLQSQSLKAVIGFFLGGLIVSYFVLPLLFA